MDRIRILFVPRMEKGTTSERSPEMQRLLDEEADLVGLPAPYDRYVYDTKKAKWPRYLLYPLDKAYLGLAGLFLARRHRAQIVFSETAHHALVGLWIARMLGIPAVWDCHGSMTLFAQSMGKGPVFTRLASFLERYLGRRTDAILTVADQDVDAFADMGVPRDRMFVVPTCVNVAGIEATAGSSAEKPPTPQRSPQVPALLFFGSFKYPPNAEALGYINDVLAPSLASQGIDCQIWIAGRDIPPTSFHPTVRALGFVSNIYACIRAADLCIVPLWRGQGVRGAVLTKVLDTMAVGTPSVLTTFASAGIPGIESGVHAFVAESAEDFPAAVGRALKDPAARRLVASRGRELVKERYDWDGQRPRILSILRSLIERSGR